MPQTSLSGIQTIDALLSTYQWGSTNATAQSLSYSFPESGSVWTNNYGGGEPFAPYSYSSLDTQQREQVNNAFTAWAELANLSFTQAADNSAGSGDIRIAFSTKVSGNTMGWAYYPISTQTPESGDVWLNTVLDDFSPGTQGFATITHELGHALGLKHPFDADNNNTATLSGAENTTQYTLMAYNNYDGAGYTQIGSSNTFMATQPTTPMLYDIAAMQFLYGANTTTRTGDDTYTFSNTAAELKTIWDAGGTDTFDASNQTLDVNINLNAGTFSSIGRVNYKLVNGFIQTTEESPVDNIAIAYNVEIENAIGGSGNDMLTGNHLANHLTGGTGNDTLNGGDGDDIAIYSGNMADYQIQNNGSSLQITSLGTNEGTDSLTGIEKLQFADTLVYADTLQAVDFKPATADEVITKPTEGDANHINYFLLQISDTLSVDASVDYTTRDGTATQGEDYIATSGTAIIKAGDTSTLIGVEIIGDNLSETDETFELVITNPQGGIFPDGITEIAASRTIIDDDPQSSADTQPVILTGINPDWVAMNMAA